MQRSTGKSRVGKSRDLFKKTGDIMGIFHAWMGRINDRNDEDLIEAEESKKRWQESTELYRKGGITIQKRGITTMVWSLT